jgi:hypothetical protein
VVLIAFLGFCRGLPCARQPDEIISRLQHRPSDVKAALHEQQHHEVQRSLVSLLTHQIEIRSLS